jgi:ribulose-phosphate 3-epimerase
MIAGSPDQDRSGSARLSASLMCADFRILARQLRSLDRAGVRRAHLDFGDGRFIANLPLGLEVFSQLPARSEWIRECHLMIEDPLAILHLFTPHADLIVFHVEAAVNPAATVAAIRRNGAGAGIAVNPSTPPEAVLPVLAQVDEILVMSVEPGFAGGRFVPAVVDKVRRIRALSERYNPGLKIVVDGAVSARTIPSLARAGADRFVGGTSGLFLGGDLEQSARALISCIEQAVSNGASTCCP